MSNTATQRIGRSIFACLLAVIGLFGLDGLLFHTGLYTSILEPDSSAGLYKLILYREQQAQKKNGDDMIVTLGDSRFAYSPKASNELTPKTGYVFRNAGVAGSELRAWYYMLRDLDPTARRYRAIVFGLNDYGDEDGNYNPDDDIRSLHYVIGCLRWSDVLGFAESFHTRSIQWEAFRGAILKGIVLQSDIDAFLTHPLKRLAYVKQSRLGFEEWTYDYVDVATTMTGLQIDWSTMQATYPPGATPEQIATTDTGLLHRPAPQTGRLAAYRREWFGKIIDRYRGSRTKIIFIRLPRGPIPRPDSLSRATGSSIREFTGRPNVLLCDEKAFYPLERPELFKDALHLNREGIARFSTMLAEEIAGMVGPPK
jgi:hypothetical protein